MYRLASANYDPEVHIYQNHYRRVDETEKAYGGCSMWFLVSGIKTKADGFGSTTLFFLYLPPL